MKHILTLAALVFATSCFAQEACPNVHDINSNGTIDIEDFLSILGLFADVDLDEDGVWDSEDACIDLGACNYDAIPSEPCAFIDVLGECGGGCEGDGDEDGICDDEDDCVGVVDECGVCNGVGPDEIVIETITILYDSVYAEPIDQWFVFEVGSDTLFSVVCSTVFYECGDQLSYQGYNYSTTLIQGECWFSENLRAENFANGEPIPSPGASAWIETEEPAIAFYGANDLLLDEYGMLYNWHAVNDWRGLCPSGWRVPTEDDMRGLIQAAGGEGGAHNLRATAGWANNSSATNSTGFSALPGGSITENGYENVGDEGLWWSASYQEDWPPAPTAWSWKITSSSQIDSTIRAVNHGFSVRCIKNPD